MNNHRFIPIIAALMLFASCEKVIEFDPSSTQSQPVLNAIPSAGKQLFVNYTYSRFFLDTNNIHPIADVDMVVTANGTDYRPVSVEGCNYFFDYTPQEDDQLSIRIKSAAGNATASTYIPRLPNISTPFTFIRDSVFKTMVINFNIDDHPNYNDYYRFTISQRDSGARYIPYRDIYDTIDTVRNTIFFCFDRPITDPTAAATQALGGYLYQELLTTDKLIDGQNHNTTMMVILLRDTNEVGTFLHEYSLNIETVTPERYQYLQDVANATSITQLITEPAPVFSNVTGALGIFAGNARRTFPLYSFINENDTTRRHK